MKQVCMTEDQFLDIYATFAESYKADSVDIFEADQDEQLRLLQIETQAWSTISEIYNKYYSE